MRGERSDLLAERSEERARRIADERYIVQVVVAALEWRGEAVGSVDECERDRPCRRDEHGDAQKGAPPKELCAPGEHHDSYTDGRGYQDTHTAPQLGCPHE